MSKKHHFTTLTNPKKYMCSVRIANMMLLKLHHDDREDLLESDADFNEEFNKIFNNQDME